MEKLALNLERFVLAECEGDDQLQFFSLVETVIDMRQLVETLTGSRISVSINTCLSACFFQFPQFLHLYHNNRWEINIL